MKLPRCDDKVCWWQRWQNILERHRSTLYREVKRNQSVHDGCYRASHAVEKASGRERRSRRNWRYGPAEFVPIEDADSAEI